MFVPSGRPVVCSVTLLALYTLTTPAPLAAQATPSSGSGSAVAAGQEPLPQRLSGTWVFNKDASSPIPEPGEVGPAPGRGGPPPSGGSGGGGNGGAGYGGGYGGRSGGRGAGGRGGPGGGNSEQMIQMRAVQRELQPPETLDIVATTTSATFTSNDGTVRKFATTGKAEKVTFGSADVDVTTAWAPNSLTQDLAAGSIKVRRAFTVTDEGHQLVVTVKSDRGDRDQSAPLMFVYDRR